jgi:hypothetical protein
MSDAPPDPTPPSRFDWEMTKLWTLVFLGNLPVPVWFATGVSSGNGVVGLIAGLAVLYWVGLVLCAGRFRVGRSLVQGGTAVALSQFIPLLQISCGALAIGIWEEMSGFSLWGYGSRSNANDQPALYNLGMFVVVLMTAQPMWIIAVLLGAFFRWHLGDTPIWFHSSADPDPTENPAS